MIGTKGALFGIPCFVIATSIDKVAAGNFAIKDPFYGPSFPVVCTQIESRIRQSLQLIT
jgi:hypothetical protein